MPIRLPLLPADPDAPFPPADGAHRVPNGLLAMGGDLSPARLLNAYRHGIFPWFSEGEPILWWCPDPRMVFDTAGVRLSSRFRRELRRSHWQVRADTAFDAVIAAFAASASAATHGRSYDLPGGETLPYREMVRRVLACLCLAQMTAGHYAKGLGHEWGLWYWGLQGKVFI